MRVLARYCIATLASLATFTTAFETRIDDKEANRQVCSGMYSKTSWGGAEDPFILVKLDKPTNLANDTDPLVSLVIFEWRDHNSIGREISGPYDRQYVCDEEAVSAGYCTRKDVGAFITAPNSTETSRSQIVNLAMHIGKDDQAPINYQVKNTGYYCVGTFGYSIDTYTGVVVFRNAYGELPAAQIAKLPFYAGITLVYAFLALGWGALYWLNRRDILAVQNYITFILVFLVLEMFMTWLFYDYQNRHGLNMGAKVLLVLVSVLSAARNSFSFFLLLIVCMGYGVVKQTLGKTMIWVRYLAVTHFAFGVIYAVASLSITPENAGPLVLLIVLPLAATLTVFYVWTLNSLGTTMKDLRERKQTVKAAMYRRLWWCILISIVVIFVFFFLNSWSFAGQSADDYIPQTWKTRWFLLDGWLNVVYFFDVSFIAYIWRPTANNRRFAMSDEIAQDDDGFDLASRDSFDIEDADLVPPAHDSNGNGKASSLGAGTASRHDRDVSPLPAPIPTKPTTLTRRSLEGETMFAIEDEDKFSDEEGDHTEQERLTK